MNFRDVELLSAYLDGHLKSSDVARLEARLSADPGLRGTLEQLRETRGLLRRLPQRRAPRNFRLTPKMAGVRAPEPRSYPAFRFATALAAFLFVAAVALNTVTPFAERHLAAAPAPAYGMGGGGGGYGGGPGQAQPPQAPVGGGSGQFTEVPAPTEAPTLQAFTLIVGTPTPEATQSVAEATAAAAQADASRAASGNPAAEAAGKTAPGLTTRAAEGPLLVPLPLVLALGVIMLICAVAAWMLRRNNERRIRDQWNQK